MSMSGVTTSVMAIFLAIYLLLPIVSPTHFNLCSTSGLCCKHRDSGCVVQHVFANRSVDTSELPCYCDHACIHLDDCCPDYREYCEVGDCIVSEWGPWSPCPMDVDPKCQTLDLEKDESDVTTQRHRIVLHPPINGGKKCPHLMQQKTCRQLQCTGEGYKNHRRAHSMKLKVKKAKTAAPTHHSHHNRHKTPRCVEMILTDVTSACLRHSPALRKGTPICIECPSSLNGKKLKRGLSQYCSNERQENHEQTKVSRGFTLDRGGCRGHLSLLVNFNDAKQSPNNQLEFKNHLHKTYGDCQMCQDGKIFRILD